MRVGFVGELAYEIHLPYDRAVPLWQALNTAAGEAGLRPFGVEAQRVLRLEKGHIIIGQDTDALTSPDEAGLARAVRMDKPFFVGQRSIEALRRRGPRQQLVGFTLDAAEPPFTECNLVMGPEGPAGRVTSVCWSPTLGRVIGMALVSPALGEAPLRVLDDAGALHAVNRATRPFVDPQGLRQRPGAKA
jgi:sarcosine oxidase subunit alpha